MKVWIFLATWVIWAVAIQHEGVMANNDNTTLTQKFSSGSEVEPAASKDETPLPFYIVSGLSNDLCLEALRNVPKIVACKRDERAQKWYFLTDRTIRNLNDQWYCLTANDLYEGSDLLILPCTSKLSNYQQWRQRSSDHTIVSLASAHEYVMDVAMSQVGLDVQHIVLYHFKGENNQKWHLDTA